MDATFGIENTFDEAAAARWRTLCVLVHGGAEPLERLLLHTVHPWVARAERTARTGSWCLVRPPWDPAGGESRPR